MGPFSGGVLDILYCMYVLIQNGMPWGLAHDLCVTSNEYPVTASLIQSLVAGYNQIA